MAAEKATCQKCGKTMDANSFYTYKDGRKTELCKKCLTMHIDNFDPNTYLWILEKMDVPYIEEEWNVLRDRAYTKDPTKINGMSVVGKYISKMKLKQWQDYTWADTERLKRESDEKKAEMQQDREKYDAEVKEAYENGEITEAEYRTLASTQSQYGDNLHAPTAMPVANGLFYNENNYLSEEELVDPSLELTHEDKIYLAMKWGRLYKPNEWIELEKKYTEMMKSFDIQDSDTTGTLILICKTYLKMNQAIDIGDMDGYQKLSRVYDALRKSAKFTAAQNKDDKGDAVDSVGELVAMCEKQGFIPRYATDIPQDKVDKTLKDMNNYLYKLVTQDLGFGQQIEDSLKKIQLQKEKNFSEIDLDNYDSEVPGATDEEISEYYETLEQQKEQDSEILFGEEDQRWL